MTLRIGLLLVLFAIAACEQAGDDAIVDAGDLIVRCGTLINGLSDTAVTDRLV